MTPAMNVTYFKRFKMEVDLYAVPPVPALPDVYTSESARGLSLVWLGPGDPGGDGSERGGRSALSPARLPLAQDALQSCGRRRLYRRFSKRVAVRWRLHY